MTDKQMKKLSRSELLEMLIAEMERGDSLEASLREATARLQERSIDIAESGTMAEAALKLNGVFDAAEAAGAQYLENLERMNSEQEEYGEKIRRTMEEKAEQLWSETTKRCGDLETGTMRRCAELLDWAEKESQAYWDETYTRLEQYCRAHSELAGFIDNIRPAARSGS